MKKGFITNKYTISVFILLAILATDIILHKGMSRVIIPENFTDKRSPQEGIARCNSELIIKEKKWRKAVNTPALAAVLDSSVSGFEMDLYFDTAKKSFYVYHDTSVISNVLIEDILQVVEQKRLAPSIWFDIKNLSEQNKNLVLEKVCALRSRFGLQKRMLIESPNISCLTTFCDSSFYTSFYTPFFNPYNEKEEALTQKIDSIAGLLKKYPVSALSGYYFQAPFLMKFFPGFPILTWADDAKISIVGNIFKYRLEHQQNISIVLYQSGN
ncbi:MAG: hypothetical protein QM687_16510 [Ferruginibacter sp.]